MLPCWVRYFFGYEKGVVMASKAGRGVVKSPFKMCHDGDTYLVIGEDGFVHAIVTRSPSMPDWKVPALVEHLHELLDLVEPAAIPLKLVSSQ